MNNRELERFLERGVRNRSIRELAQRGILREFTSIDLALRDLIGNVNKFFWVLYPDKLPSSLRVDYERSGYIAMDLYN